MTDEDDALTVRPMSPGRVPVASPSARQSLEPMPAKVILLVALGIAVVTAGFVTVLWWAGTAGLSGQVLVTARFDALRTGLSIGIGGGGVFALYLAWRRQHATEIGLVQKERDLADVARAYELQREVADHSRADAEARRITDLYAKSVEQLGSDKAPVRLGGLYALERLAQDNSDRPALRQTVVDVLCAYLRMPFTLPGDRPGGDADDQARARYDERAQEREVRLTAQRILTAHLRSGPESDVPAATFWRDTDLDLTGATLVDFDLARCRVRRVTFDAALFTGHASFREAVFEGDAMFDDAVFRGGTSFSDATFNGFTGFVNAQFASVGFAKAKFSKVAMFGATVFKQGVRFDGVMFEGDVWLRGATFAGNAEFVRTTFSKNVELSEVQVSQDLVFDECAVRHPIPARAYWPSGWQPAEEHGAFAERLGTWHHIVRVDPAAT